MAINRATKIHSFLYEKFERLFLFLVSCVIIFCSIQHSFLILFPPAFLQYLIAGVYHLRFCFAIFFYCFTILSFCFSIITGFLHVNCDQIFQKGPRKGYSFTRALYDPPHHGCSFSISSSTRLCFLKQFFFTYTSLA